MNGWSADVSSLIGGLGKEIIGAARAVRAVLNNDPFEVLAYRGYGNADRAFIYGRVLKKRDVSLSSDRDSAFRNLLNTYRRADSDPLAFASVTVDYAGQSVGMQADDEGFFGGWIELANPVEVDKEWRDYDVKLVSHSRPTVGDVTAKGEILTPETGVQFGLISDLDDTVIQSRVSNFLQAARGVLLGNARTRLPFPGVAAFYEALRNGGGGEEKNPIFYVSSSPWNIYDVIAEFMDIQKIPKGPIFLRDWDIGWDSLSSAHHFDHKTKVIRSILELYPALQFILIGDTSQHDPEIYHQIVTEFPNRVKAIYIRDVYPRPGT